MNHINPIHILTLLVVVIFLFAVKLGQTKDELALSKQSYNETLEMVTKIKGFKNIYDAKDTVKKGLDRVLKQPSLASANFEQKMTNNSITITTASIDKAALDSLMSKILNGAYNINMLEIKKLSDEKATVSMEIKWQK